MQPGSQGPKYPNRALTRAPAQIEITPDLLLPGFVMRFARNEEIFGEEEPADFGYKVVSGAVRTIRILNDGRRQIGGFYLPGDVFGLEQGETHRFSAEAIAPSEVALVRRSALNAAAMTDSAAARQLWSLTSRELERVEDHVLLLGRKNAVERVAAFLLRMSDRCETRSAWVDLPMSRTDIADYLGLTIETVSRTLTQLEQGRAIARPNTRQIVLRNRSALTELNA